MNKYEQYLSDRFAGPSAFLLAGELVDELRRRFNISEVYARKVIQRAAQTRIMNSSSPLTFGKGQNLYYGGDGVLDRCRIMSASKLSRPPLYRLLSVMEMQDGVISHFEAMKVASCPVTSGKTKASSLSAIVYPLVKLATRNAELLTARFGRHADVAGPPGKEYNYVVLTGHRPARKEGSQTSFAHSIRRP